MRVWNEQAAQFLAHHFVCTATDRLNRRESKNKRTASYRISSLSARFPECFPALRKDAKRVQV